MLKLFSAILIICSFAGIGVYFSSLEKQRVGALKNILTMLSLAETQLRYLNIPVAELMKNLSENPAVSGLRFIGRCSDMLENGAAFSLAWKNSIEEDCSLEKLLPETYESLVMLGGEIGSTDLEGQLSSCGYYKQIFTAALSEREEKCRRSSKLCPPLGLLLGITAAIMII